MDFKNQTFSGGEVTLDYNRFESCHFENCIVLFGGGQFNLTDVTMNNVRFGLMDAADRALAFLRVIRAAPNGPQLIEELLKAQQPPAGTVTIN